MNRRNRLGFTLIEVLVASMIIGLMLPPLGAAFYNFTKVPPEKTHELTAINEVHQVAQWIVDDGTQSTYYMAGEFWQKTAAGKLELVAGYTLEADGTLTRYTDYSDATSGVAIGQHITALNFESQPTFLKVYIESTIEGIGGQTQDSGTVFVFLKSAPPAQLTYAIFCGEGGIKITGGDKIIDGNVYSGGPVTIAGGGGTGNIINGTLEAPDVVITGGNPDPERVEPWTEQVFPPIWIPEQFQPDWYPGPYYNDTNYFSVYGNTLSGNLAPGVYYSESKVTIEGHTSGNVTIIAPSIKARGVDINLTAYYGGMLLWATGPDPSGQKALEMSPNGGYFEGFIYASEGSVSISAQGGTVINGSIIAKAVEISGDLWLISR